MKEKNNKIKEKFSKFKTKKAISFVILLITMVVILILVGAVIISLRKSRSIDSANEAALKSDLQTIKDNYEIKYNDLLYDNQGEKNKITEEDLKDVVPDKYKPDFIALPEGPAYIGEDDKVKEIAEELDYIIGYPNDRIEIDFVNLISTSNTINVEVGIKETDLTIKNIEYYISEDEQNWTKVESLDLTNEFTNLKEDTYYKVKVVITADNDEKTTSRIYTIKTKVADFEPGELEFTKENADGDKYTSGTWTNKSIYIKIKEDGLDTSYEAEGANEIGRGTKVDSLVTESGITKVRVTTKRDETTKAREYEIKIDKYMPVINSVVSSNTRPTNKNVILTGKAIDTLSGLVAYQFSKDGTIGENSSGWEKIDQTTNEISVSKEIEESGTYYFYVKDAAGNVVKKEIVVDNIDKTPPVVTSINVTDPVAGEYREGQTITMVATFSENIVGTSPSLVIRFGTGAQRNTVAGQINGNTITYTYTIVDGDDGVLSTVSYTGIVEDLVGNETVVENKEIGGNKIIADTTPPTLTNINVTSPDTGTYKAGNKITIVATYSENMKGIPPTLKIKFGNGNERIISTGTINENKIIYEYTIENGDDGVLTSTSYTGNITDIAGNNLSVSNKALGGNTITADTTAPVLTSINVTSPDAGSYNVGQSITLVATYSEQITGTSPILKIKFGNGAQRATVASEITGKTITYTYTIVNGDNGTIACSSYTGSVADLSGNILNLSSKTLGGNEVKADTVAPTQDAPALVANTNSITATMKQVDDVSGINPTTRQYAYKRTDSSTWSSWISSSDASYVFSGLEKNVSYQVKTKVSDNVGNSSESLVATVSTLDITKPTLSPSATTWTNKDVIVTITYPNIPGTTRQYSTDGTNWSNANALSQQVTVNTNNTTVYARVIDSTNQTSGNATYKVTNLDKTLPTMNSLTSSNTAITNQNITLTGKAIDTVSGIVAYQFSTSASITASSGGWTTISNTKTQVTHTYIATSSATYYYYVKDEAGNVNKISISVTNIDKTAPTLSSINVTAPSAGTYRVGQAVTIVATYSENIIGTAPVLKIKFGTSTEKTATAGAISGKTITYTYTIASGDNGSLATTSYTGTVKDAAGNSLTVSNKTIGGNAIKADTTAPTNTVPTATANTNSVTVTFKQTDALSGINGATRQYAIKKKSDTTWSAWVTSNSSTYTFNSLVKNTEYQVKTKASDNAGNSTESAVCNINTLDIGKPTLTPSATTWTNKNVDVTITYANISGTTRQYSTDGTNWSNASGTTQKVTVSSNNVTVYARIIDSTNQTGGNASYKVTNIDKLPPADFTPTFAADVRSIKVTATTNDNGNTTNGSSGIKNYLFSKDNGSTWSTAQTGNVYTITGLSPETSYNIKVKVTDNAGNERITTAKSVKTLKVIAKIGTTEYSSIQKAFNAAPDNTATTVTLVASTSESPTLGASKNVVFNLNNLTVTGTVNSNGTLYMKSGTISGAINLLGAKTDTLENITLSGSLTIGSSADKNTTVRIKGGSYTSSGNTIVNWGKELIFENNSSGIGPKAVTLGDGRATLYNAPGAKMVINSGEYSSPTYASIRNFGTVDIKGGTFKMTNTVSDADTTSSVLLNDSNGILNITGNPTITSTSGGILNFGRSKSYNYR